MLRKIALTGLATAVIAGGLASATPAFAANKAHGTVFFTDSTPYVQTFDGYGATPEDATMASLYAMRAAAIKIGGVDRCAKLQAYYFSQVAEDVFWGKTRAYCSAKADYTIRTENLDGQQEQRQQIMDNYTDAKKAEGCTPLSAGWYNGDGQVWITAHALCPAS